MSRVKKLSRRQVGDWQATRAATAAVAAPAAAAAMTDIGRFLPGCPNAHFSQARLECRNFFQFLFRFFVARRLFMTHPSSHDKQKISL